jgi:hypothetical protein
MWGSREENKQKAVVILSEGVCESKDPKHVDGTKKNDRNSG